VGRYIGGVFKPGGGTLGEINGRKKNPLGQGEIKPHWPNGGEISSMGWKDGDKKTCVNAGEKQSSGVKGTDKVYSENLGELPTMEQGLKKTTGGGVHRKRGIRSILHFPSRGGHGSLLGRE